MSGTQGDTNNDENLKRQGSFRKLLPLNTNGDSQLSMSVKMIDRPILSQTNKEYAIYLQEYNILSEYMVWSTICEARNVSRRNLQIYYYTSAKLSRWRMSFFHPLIDPESGELCTLWGFPEWRKSNRIWQLIQFITKIFTKVDIKMNPINQEASNLLEKNFEAFRDRVKKCVRESLNRVYNASTVDDPHYITFSQYVSELYDTIKKEIYEPKEEEEENKALGLSWVQPGSLQPFSKPETR
ncbi:AKT-interacting protein isoform X2 [Xylocopa sonorina]|uniref:AKT-interacting protein isoform X2 n=1 Tax=Xylocopa sonorina TaxID=1818115 RepID=UPI00403A91EE